MTQSVLALSVALSISAVSTPSMIQPIFHLHAVHLNLIVIVILTRIRALKTERYLVLLITSSSRHIQSLSCSLTHVAATFISPSNLVCTIQVEADYGNEHKISTSPCLEGNTSDLHSWFMIQSATDLNHLVIQNQNNLIIDSQFVCLFSFSRKFALDIAAIFTSP